VCCLCSCTAVSSFALTPRDSFLTPIKDVLLLLFELRPFPAFRDRLPLMTPPLPPSVSCVSFCLPKRAAIMLVVVGRIGSAPPPSFPQLASPLSASSESIKAYRFLEPRRFPATPSPLFSGLLLFLYHVRTSQMTFWFSELLR